jgi:hypothetical protein
MTVIEQYADELYGKDYAWQICFLVANHYPQNIRQWAADQILLVVVQREYAGKRALKLVQIVREATRINGLLSWIN